MIVGWHWSGACLGRPRQYVDHREAFHPRRAQLWAGPRGSDRLPQAAHAHRRPQRLRQDGASPPAGGRLRARPACCSARGAYRCRSPEPAEATPSAQTIIECLKHAVTGEWPPNSHAGKSFVHDPKARGREGVVSRVGPHPRGAAVGGGRRGGEGRDQAGLQDCDGQAVRGVPHLPGDAEEGRQVRVQGAGPDHPHSGRGWRGARRARGASAAAR